jgi:hypothetical protein
MSFLLTTFYKGDQIRESEMGVACGTSGREEKCLQDFGGET